MDFETNALKCMDKMFSFSIQICFLKEERKTNIKANFERLNYTMRNGKDKHDFTFNH